jgi:ubiquinol-cytochrome c reductase cytochrome c1 subunit
MKKLLTTTLALAALSISPLIAGGDDTEELVRQDWTFDGMTGTFDREDLQHGFQVYKEVCAACHGIKRIRFRELHSLGYNEDEIKAIAAGYEVKDGPDDMGEMYERSARPSDAFPSPYANDKAARAANNGALPPDLSLITKARVGGADYLYSLLTGYGGEVPAGQHVSEGLYYNPWFPGHQIAMVPPLQEGLVTYSDGSSPSIAEMAKAVTTFLAWAAEPEMENRKQSGIEALIYLAVFSLLMYLVMRQVWSRVEK